MAITYPNGSTGFPSKVADLCNHVFVEGVAFRGPWANVPNTETLAAAKTIAITDPWVHYFTPTAARDVTMPATTTVGTWLIVNVDTTYTLTIKTAAAATIGTVGPSQAALVICDGTTWTISRLMGGTAAASAYTQTYSTADRTVAAPTAAAITDNTTGTAGSTAAAGVGVFNLVIPITMDAGTSAGEVITAITPGHKFKILGWSFVTSVAGVGSGASRAYNMEIGTTDVGTSPSVLTLTEASTATVGSLTAGAAVSGANTGTAADTFSIEVASGGTAFSAGSGAFIVRVQNMDTADAIASLIAEHTKIVADDLDNRKTITAIIDDLQASRISG